MTYYKFRKLSKRAPDVRRPKSKTGPGAEEELTGLVKGKKASDLEERYANALDELGNIDYYKFSVLIETPFQIPGQLNEIDFFVYVGPFVYPMEIDGEMAHKTQEQRAADMARDQMLNPIIKQKWPGAMPIERIPGWKLETRDDARALVRRQF